MLSISELEKFLEENSGDLSWYYDEAEQVVYIRSDQYKEAIKIALNKLNILTIAGIRHMLCGGKNVVQVTRVTGYFANVRGWNPGKQGELKDRVRVNGGKFVETPALTDKDKQEIIETYVSAGAAAVCSITAHKKEEDAPLQSNAQGSD